MSNLKTPISRLSLLVLLGIAPAGCTVMPTGEAAHAQVSAGPNAKIEGNDGTILTGQLLNGSITISCGQGELMLLTDRIFSIDFGKDGDSVMSESVKVFGRVEDTEFRLRNEHGVFRLQKQNLRAIQFTDIQGSAPSAGAATAPSHVYPSSPNP
ncbi:MAG: hypothetical protein JO353_12155 [Phycisphaerae bacterium]|nr:hypothetical protein [Phycisphaerae bacterium]